MQCYGVSSNAMLWLQSYLENRRQTVFFNGSFSEEKPVFCGVPQGSFLGPLLYSIFTNDLPLATKNAKVTRYADDSTIYASKTSILELENILTEELNLIVEWITNNKLVLNVSKTKCIVFGTNRMLSDKPKLNLHVQDMLVEQVNEVKLLGIIVDNKLSWSAHIARVVSKMGRGLSG